MPPKDSILLDLPGFRIVEVTGHNWLTLRVESDNPVQCPHCQASRFRIKDSFVRRIRHVLYGQRPSWLELRAHKYFCRSCGRYFNSRFPGIKPRRRATEPCRVEVCQRHHEGQTQRSLSKYLRLGSATVERWYQEYFVIKNRELMSAQCPRILGIDEHFFTRKEGFATTLVNLGSHRVFDVALGRSEESLRSYLRKLIGKNQVRVVVMDLSEGYRSLARKHFPNAMIVADRFHVIRLVNQQFVKTWGELDGVGRKSRGLLSLIRRHPDNFKPGQQEKLFKYLDGIPGMRILYEVWQDLLRLLRMKGCNQGHCRKIVPEFLWIIEELKQIKFQHLQSLGYTLDNWKEEIGRMFRFSKTNGITEGLHNKMEMLSRRAFGFRNFENYRLRVRVVCG